MMATKKTPTPVVPAPPYGRPLNKDEIEFVKENIKKLQEYGKKGKHGKKEKTD
jgi:hypothetical protein|tara:strand:- start:226 stop:384 length:159 start_codon:yes stop_codon:yes gene_type:complete